jgi:VanZ family protein
MAAADEQKRATRNPRSLPAIISAWLPVALWAGAIQAFAGDDFSKPSTSRFIDPFFRWLFPDITPEFLEVVHLVIRKSAHLVEYAILALLAQRAFRRSGLRGLWLTAGSLALVAAVAIVDETRQASFATRDGTLDDVLLDLAGGALALAGAKLFALYRRSSGPR